MTNVAQIPNLPSAVALAGSELFEAVQAGVSTKVTTAQISAYVQATPLAALTFTTPLMRVGNVVSLTIVPASLGGTGQSLYTIGDILYADTTTTLARLPEAALGNVLHSGGVAGPPSWAKVNLATDTIGQVPGSAQVFLDARIYGVTGNGTDQTVALQLAIDTCIYQQFQTLVLPAGVILTSAAIQVGYGTDFRSIKIVGQGRKYDGEANFSGTVINSTQVNAPALNIQGGREVVLEDLTLIGPNDSYLHNNLPMQPTPPGYDDTVATNWLNPTILAANPNAFSQYAPLAGITIDAYSGAQPAIHYPAVTYPSQWVGPGVPQYGKLHTSSVKLNRVEIGGYVVGLCIEPCNDDGNGDFVSLHECSIHDTIYAISAGNSQGRNVGLTDCNMSAIYTCFTNTLFGMQRGKLAGTISNLSIGNCYEIFNLELAYAAPMVFIDLYAELLWRLGDSVGFNSNQRSLVFIGSTFNFTAQVDARGVPATIMTQTETPIVFEACDFIGYPDVISFYNFYAIGMDSCSFRPNNSPTNPVQYLAYNATVGGCVFATQSQYFNANTKQTRYLQYNVDTGSSALVVEDSVGSHCSRSNSPNGWAANFLPYAEGMHPVAGPNQLGLAFISKSGLASVNLAGKQLTFRFSSRNEWTFNINGPLPGDIIWDDGTGTVFRIDSRLGLSISATMLNNYVLSGGAYVTVSAISLNSGNFIVLNTRRYLCSEPLIATGTSGSGNLTAVGRGDGSFTNISEILVNDWLMVDYFTDPFWTQSGTAAQVTAVNAGAGTMSLTATATVNFTNKLFPPFVRTMASATSAIGQYDWPLPKQIPLRAPDTLWPNTPIDDSAPFGQSDWSAPKLPPFHPVEATVTHPRTL